MKRRIIGVAAALLVLVVASAPGRALESLLEHQCFKGDSERRIEACSELIDAPDTPREFRSMAFAMRALSFSLRGEFATSIRDYDQAIALMPNYAVALNNRAWAYFKWGKAPQGLPDVEMSLLLDPTSPHALDTRAHIRQWLGDRQGALRDYEAAMVFGGPRMVKLYQCGLAQHKLYTGEFDGIYSPAVRRAMQMCLELKDCDPLPPDEECRAATS